MSRMGRQALRGSSPEMQRRASSSEVARWVANGEARLEVSPHDVLGRGGEGIVYSGMVVNDKTGQFKPVAAKKLHGHADSGSALIEVARHRAVTDPNESSAMGGVVKNYGEMSPVDASGPMMGVSSSEYSADNSPKQEDKYIVTSLCLLSFKDLMPFIAAVRTTPGYEFEYLKIIIDFMTSMLNALKSFDAKDMAHRDIKPDNTALVSDAESGSPMPVLLDCGGARTQEEIRENHGHIMTLTPYYAAPEQMVMLNERSDIVERQSTQKIDAFSIGMMLCELSGKPLTYLDAEGCEIQETFPLLFRKKELFLQAADSTTKTPQQLEEDAITSQMTEISLWKNSAILKECIGNMAEWFVDSLPEHRPSIDVFEAALDRIFAIFLRQIEVSETSLEDITAWVNAFYKDCETKVRERKQQSAAVKGTDDERNNLKSFNTETLVSFSPVQGETAGSPLYHHSMFSASEVRKAVEGTLPEFAPPPPMTMHPR